MTQTTVQRLSTKVLSNIFDFIPPKMLFELLKVNRQWRKAVKKYGVVRLDLSKCQNQKIRIYMATLHEQLKPFQCSHIQYILVDSFSPLAPSVFKRLQQLCPNVVYFDYSRQPFQNLQYLRHYFLDHSTTEGGDRCILWKKLLHLPACHRDSAKVWPRHYASQLFSLYARLDDFASVTMAEKGYLVMTLPSMPWLTYIVIDLRKKIDERTIHCLHEQCPSLSVLHIKHAQLNCRTDRQSPPPRQSISPVVALKELILERVMFSSFTSLLYLSLKYTNIQTMVLYMNKHSIPPGADRPKEKRAIRRHLYLLISSLKRLKNLTVYLDDWYVSGSPVFAIWPGKEVHEWHTTTAGQKVEHFRINYGDVKVKLSDLVR